MKTIKFLPFLIMALLTISLSSCGGKGKSTSVADREKAMVGMWRCDYDDDYAIRTYNEDGTGTLVARTYNGNESYECTSIFYFDKKDNQMKVVDSGREHGGWSEELLVVYVNEKELAIEEKDVVVYHRIK